MVSLEPREGHYGEDEMQSDRTGHRIKLELDPEQWHELSSAAGNARDGSRVVKVDKRALELLISDHSKLIAHHRGEIDGHK